MSFGTQGDGVRRSRDVRHEISSHQNLTAPASSPTASGNVSDASGSLSSSPTTPAKSTTTRTVNRGAHQSTPHPKTGKRLDRDTPSPPSTPRKVDDTVGSFFLNLLRLTLCVAVGVGGARLGGLLSSRSWVKLTACVTSMAIYLAFDAVVFSKINAPQEPSSSRSEERELDSV